MKIRKKEPGNFCYIHLLHRGRVFSILAGMQPIFVPVEIFNLDDNVYIRYPSSYSSLHCKIEKVLVEYFRLDYDDSQLLNVWASSLGLKDCLVFARDSPYRGIRLLRQDPFATIISFICSQNNTISRIKRMVFFLCTKFGQEIKHYQDQSLYAFPSASTLSTPDLLQVLVENKFGYRAKYICSAVKFICDKRLVSRESYFEFFAPNVSHRLQEIDGVGPKVADCISLMSFDCTWIVPLDTHMLKWFRRFGHDLPSNINDRLRSSIQAFFIEKFGQFAGWAHLVHHTIVYFI